MSKKKRPKEEVGHQSEKAKKDESAYVPQDRKIDWDLNINVKHKLNQKQSLIRDTMVDKKTKCVMIDGVYGTSKTWLCVLSALELIKDKKCSGIVYIRNPVESSSTGKIGFLKGDESDKLAPYAAPLIQKLDEFLPRDQVDRLQKEGFIEVLPLGFTRGLSWNTKIIIVDEAACLTRDDIFLLMSRCGPFTKIFFVGDSQNQNDIGNKSGFKQMFDLFYDEESMKNGVFCFEMKDIEDIVRSGFVRYLMLKTGLIKKTQYKQDKSESMFPE